ncbi:hypothetical protein SLOPH_2376 [Spraguea lophii 42_110]|uniref:Spindle pole body component n=1 Tax=Spraguea lophii (strain 42_110) TaxID=1358809 RepID=S7WDM9_SPRLO|nr:hypothetical protein SLOPH_2376 [Spraguea lophii 42_110]
MKNFFFNQPADTSTVKDILYYLCGINYINTPYKSINDTIDNYIKLQEYVYHNEYATDIIKRIFASLINNILKEYLQLISNLHFNNTEIENNSFVNNQCIDLNIEEVLIKIEPYNHMFGELIKILSSTDNLSCINLLNNIFYNSKYTSVDLQQFFFRCKKYVDEEIFLWVDRGKIGYLNIIGCYKNIDNILDELDYDKIPYKHMFYISNDNIPYFYVMGRNDSITHTNPHKNILELILDIGSIEYFLNVIKKEDMILNIEKDKMVSDIKNPNVVNNITTKINERSILNDSIISNDSTITTANLLNKNIEINMKNLSKIYYNKLINLYNIYYHNIIEEYNTIRNYLLLFNISYLEDLFREIENKRNPVLNNNLPNILKYKIFKNRIEKDVRLILSIEKFDRTNKDNKNNDNTHNENKNNATIISINDYDKSKSLDHIYKLGIKYTPKHLKYFISKKTKNEYELIFRFLYILNFIKYKYNILNKEKNIFVANVINFNNKLLSSFYMNISSDTMEYNYEEDIDENEKYIRMLKILDKLNNDTKYILRMLYLTSTSIFEPLSEYIMLTTEYIDITSKYMVNVIDKDISTNNKNNQEMINSNFNKKLFKILRELRDAMKKDNINLYLLYYLESMDKRI